jgi:hypothetical protein
MATSALHALAFLASQPWVSAPIVACAIMGREVIRRLAFLCGLSIALRGTSGRNRAYVLAAYASCFATRSRRSSDRGS